MTNVETVSDLCAALSVCSEQLAEMHRRLDLLESKLEECRALLGKLEGREQWLRGSLNVFPAGVGSFADAGRGSS